MTGSDAEPLIDQLIDVGNKALADHYHEDLCSCSTWPDACASGLKPFTWDTNAFAIALPAILAAYEKQRTTDHSPHAYLSTGCHHGRHAYCQATDGQAGPKDPAKCKWCPSRCVCSCHPPAPADPGTAVPDASTFLFVACQHGEHAPTCKARYDGYGRTLLCSCDCHQTPG